MKFPRFAVLLGCSWLALSMSAQAANLVTEQLCFDGYPQALSVEIADTDATRARGLMLREQLEPHAGMLFRYRSKRPGSNGFWMYNTWIPLDIAFLDEAGRIVSILTMQPCESIDPSRCQVYSPGVDYHAALELNAGYFAKHQIGLGRRLQACDAQSVSP